MFRFARAEKLELVIQSAIRKICLATRFQCCYTIEAAQGTLAQTMVAVDHPLSDDEFLDKFLQGTSRTFALAIPLLAVQRRREVGLSYLLFRVADSIEDAPNNDSATKKSLLAALKRCFSMSASGSPPLSEYASADARSFAGLWPEQSPTGRLLEEFPRLMNIFGEMPPSVSQALGKALKSTISGMIGFIDASKNLPNQIQIQTISDLRLYCYAVAGVVGELLTDIFVFHHPSGLPAHKELRRLSVGFGEFLQLINILKDAHSDALSGRVFIPTESSRDSIYELALGGRNDTLLYIRLLEKNDFPADIILFCRFLYLLADGSLQRLRSGGAGSKLTRDEVKQILADVKSEFAVLPA